MYIEFKDQWLDLLKDIATSESLKFQLNSMHRYGTSARIEYSSFDQEELKAIYAKAKELGDRSIMMQVSSYLKFLEAPKGAKMPNLKVFCAAIKEYLNDGAINHWIFKTTNDVTLPYLVTKIKYNEPRDKDDQATVSLDFKANGVKDYTNGVSFDTADVQSKTIEQILAAAHLEKETQELIDAFNADTETFFKERPCFNKQYVVTGKVYACSNHWRDTIQEFRSVKAINEEGIHKRTYTYQLASDFWTDGDSQILIVPTHPYLFMYSLSTYEQFYAHISLVKEYVYDDSLREKLVLPDNHRDLLDILTNDLDILRGDIIEGKSTGTTILCMGKPGLGKTLSAEVYAEITHKALYKVNSGQLGTTPEKVEANLEDILARAERWGAVMLIDEADTYIRARDNDIEHNAIVAAFLRTLEYFHGLLFLTTNRGDDVDDAIVSRCIATIKYETPSRKAAKRIWQVLSKEFSVDLSAELIDILINEFPAASGRDIKELLRLTARFTKAKNMQPTLEAFVSCAQFRGLSMKGETNE